MVRFRRRKCANVVVLTQGLRHKRISCICSARKRAVRRAVPGSPAARSAAAAAAIQRARRRAAQHTRTRTRAASGRKRGYGRVAARRGAAASGRLRRQECSAASGREVAVGTAEAAARGPEAAAGPAPAADRRRGRGLPRARGPRFARVSAPPVQLRRTPPAAGGRRAQSHRPPLRRSAAGPLLPPWRGAPRRVWAEAAAAPAGAWLRMGVRAAMRTRRQGSGYGTRSALFVPLVAVRCGRERKEIAPSSTLPEPDTPLVGPGGGASLAAGGAILRLSACERWRETPGELSLSLAPAQTSRPGPCGRGGARWPLRARRPRMSPCPSRAVVAYAFRSRRAARRGRFPWGIYNHLSPAEPEMAVFKYIGAARQNVSRSSALCLL